MPEPLHRPYATLSRADLTLATVAARASWRDAYRKGPYLRRLMDLQEEWTERRDTAGYHAALAQEEAERRAVAEGNRRALTELNGRST